MSRRDSPTTVFTMRIAGAAMFCFVLYIGLRDFKNEFGFSFFEFGRYFEYRDTGLPMFAASAIFSGFLLIPIIFWIKHIPWEEEENDADFDEDRHRIKMKILLFGLPAGFLILSFSIALGIAANWFFTPYIRFGFAPWAYWIGIFLCFGVVKKLIQFSRKR